MPFVVRSNIEAEQQFLRAISVERSTHRRSLMNQLGFYLVAKEKQHFQQLAKTRSSNGVTWPPHTESTRRRRYALAKAGKLTSVAPDTIGILTRYLLVSFRFRFTSNQVRITNTAPYAGAFAKTRPIYPQTFPPNWLSGCEGIVQRYLDKLTKGLNP